jgi:hypothetical protein
MKKGYSNLQRCSRRLLPTTAKLESKGHEVWVDVFSPLQYIQKAWMWTLKSNLWLTVRCGLHASWMHQHKCSTIARDETLLWLMHTEYCTTLPCLQISLIDPATSSLPMFLFSSMMILLSLNAACSTGGTLALSSCLISSIKSKALWNVLRF